MPKYENFSVWIEVEGRPLPEYDIKVLDKDRTIECWVPSELNKPFEICVDDRVRSYSSAFDVRIDGKEIPCSRVILKSDEVTKCPSTRVKGYHLTKKKMQRLYFSKCILLDEDTYIPSVSGRVGQIEVEMEQVRTRKVKATTRPKLIIPTLLLNEKVHKGIDHGVRVGDEIIESIDPYPTYSTQRLRRLWTFIFKYRPMDLDDVEPLQQRVHELKDIVEFLEERIRDLNGQRQLQSRD